MPQPHFGRRKPLIAYSITLVIVVSMIGALMLTNDPGRLSTHDPFAYKQDMLVISASTDAGRNQLQISVVNTGQVDATVTLVEFHGVALASSDIAIGGGFTRTPNDTFALPSRASGPDDCESLFGHP